MCACIFPSRQLTFIKACSSEMLACLVIHAHTHSCTTCIARETSHSRLPQGVCVGVCVCVYVCKVCVCVRVCGLWLLWISHQPPEITSSMFIDIACVVFGYINSQQPQTTRVHTRTG